MTCSMCHAVLPLLGIFETDKYSKVTTYEALKKGQRSIPPLMLTVECISTPGCPLVRSPPPQSSKKLWMKSSKVCQILYAIYTTSWSQVPQIRTVAQPQGSACEVETEWHSFEADQMYFYARIHHIPRAEN